MMNRFQMLSTYVLSCAACFFIGVNYRSVKQDVKTAATVDRVIDTARDILGRKHLTKFEDCEIVDPQTDEPAKPIGEVLGSLADKIMQSRQQHQQPVAPPSAASVPPDPKPSPMDKSTKAAPQPPAIGVSQQVAKAEPKPQRFTVGYDAPRTPSKPKQSPTGGATTDDMIRYSRSLTDPQQQSSGGGGRGIFRGRFR